MKISKEKVMYSIYAVATAILIILALSGCTAFNNVVKNDSLVSQLAVEAATARVLHEHPKWKDETVSITAAAITAIDSRVTTDLASVDSYVKSRINWGRLTPEEQVLVSVLISQVVRNLEDAFLAQGVKVPSEQMIAVRQVLTWISDTAKRQ